MKYISAIIQIFVVMLSLLACSNINATQARPSNKDNCTAITAATAQQWQALPTFHNIEEYEQYISEGIDTESFITYKMLQNFGDFDLFVDYGHTKGTQYLYAMVDENGYCFDIHIEPLSEEQKAEITAEKPPHSDLRTSISRAKYYSISDVLFEYYDGKLYSISWHTATHVYTLKGGYTIRPCDYSGDKVTLLSKLLNAETAEAAVAEFNAKVAQARAEKAN